MLGERAGPGGAGPCPPQALNEEKGSLDRSPSKNIYLNVAVNTLKKLRGLGPGAGAGLNSKSCPRRLGLGLQQPPPVRRAVRQRLCRPGYLALLGRVWPCALKRASSHC